MSADPFIGVLSLDTDFERIRGDAGHPQSYHMPARIRVIPGAGAPDIVQDTPPPTDLVQMFINEAKVFEDEGAVAITSTCGFLIHVQNQIAAAVQVPVMVSALSLAPKLVKSYGKGRVGVLTASAAQLGCNAYTAASVAQSDIVVKGLEGSEIFSTMFLQAKGKPKPAINKAEMERAVLNAASEFASQSPSIHALLLECGNLPPYQKTIAESLGLPVFSILDAMLLLTRGMEGFAHDRGAGQVSGYERRPD